jgi:predicted DNA-binding protein (MmcQ/YjbR family)
MNAEGLRIFCLSLPHATEDIKWGHDLCFLIAKKMFAVGSLEQTDEHVVSFKCTPERFAELIEIAGIIPAPYMARNHWVTLQRWDALRDDEIRNLILQSYALVLAKLPKRLQNELSSPPPKKTGQVAVKKKSKRLSSR